MLDTDGLVVEYQLLGFSNSVLINYLKSIHVQNYTATWVFALSFTQVYCPMVTYIDDGKDVISLRIPRSFQNTTQCVIHSAYYSDLSVTCLALGY